MRRFVIFCVVENAASPLLSKYYFHSIEDFPGVFAKINWGGPVCCWEGNGDEARQKLQVLKALHPTWQIELEELEMYGLG